MSDSFSHSLGLCYKRFWVHSPTYQQWAPKRIRPSGWMSQSCWAALTSLLLGWVKTISVRLHWAGHRDLQCSGSTSEIPPVALEVLPNPLDSKKPTQISLLPPLLLVLPWFPSCVFLTSVLAPTCPFAHFFCAPCLWSSSFNISYSGACGPRCRHPSWARGADHGNLLGQALSGAGLYSRSWLSGLPVTV